MLSIKPDTDKQHLESGSHQNKEKEEDMKLEEAGVGEDVGELREEMRDVHDHISLYICMTFSEMLCTFYGNYIEKIMKYYKSLSNTIHSHDVDFVCTDPAFHPLPCPRQHTHMHTLLFSRLI